MESKKTLFTLLGLTLVVLTFAFVNPVQSQDKDKDFAVPAFSDLPLLGPQSASTQMLVSNPTREGLSPLPDVERLRWMDINRDFQLNDFDVKQLQAIIENLHGEKLTGLQLSIRFKGEQKNQKESFPLLYDLDRDGMFTSFDVDYFTEIINKLDEGATDGNELVQKFRFEIFPDHRHQE